MIVHGMILSIVMVVNYPDGQQSIEQFWHLFTGPTAIEYCNNARSRLESMTVHGIVSVHATCNRD